MAGASKRSGWSAGTRLSTARQRSRPVDRGIGHERDESGNALRLVGDGLRLGEDAEGSHGQVGILPGDDLRRGRGRAPDLPESRPRRPGGDSRPWSGPARIRVPARTRADRGRSGGSARSASPARPSSPSLRAPPGRRSCGACATPVGGGAQSLAAGASSRPCRTRSSSSKTAVHLPSGPPRCHRPPPPRPCQPGGRGPRAPPRWSSRHARKDPSPGGSRELLESCACRLEHQIAHGGHGREARAAGRPVPPGA